MSLQPQIKHINNMVNLKYLTKMLWRARVLLVKTALPRCSMLLNILMVLANFPGLIFQFSKKTSVATVATLTVTHNAGVVSSPIYLHVMCNAGPVSTSENV